jgi:thiosulfate/3-mercaptopyruvate sulfurtransferase
MEQQDSPFVNPAWLQEHLPEPGLTVLDVRWALPQGADRSSYLQAHIPGARFIDLDQALADPAGPRGRHPLPSIERFTAAMQRAGVTRDGLVVAYDAGTAAAARAWWLLRAAGHAGTKVLDGGLAGWIASGGGVEAGAVEAGSGDFVASGFRGWISADETAQLIASGQAVVDARASDRFHGAPSPYDPRPGHIPGAHSLPWTGAYREGRVLPSEELAFLIDEATGGGAPAGAYCGSGVTACALILALESAGIRDVRLYPGSWSEWAQAPERPAEL